MTERIAVVVDVGGSSLKGTVVRDRDPVAAPLIDPPLSVPSRADGTFPEILGAFGQLFAALDAAVAARFGDARITALGLGFPGPFDYRQGIAYMQGLAKYDALCGRPLTPELLAALRTACTHCTVTSDPVVRYENDARVFALGAWVTDGLPDGRTAGLTLGTGCGSGFVADGVWVTGDFDAYDLPPDGYVYAEPLDGARVDDKVSARALLELARARGLEVADGAALARRADDGDPDARGVYATVGRRLEQVLTRVLGAYAPERVYLGGRIARSFTHLRRGFRDPAVADRIRVDRDSARTACVGLGRMLWTEIPHDTL